MILLSIIIYITILNDKNYMQMRRRLIILCFLLFTFTGAASAADDDPNHISINCGGGAAPATTLRGRKWGGDAAALKGSSTASTVKGGELITAVDPVPYKTARISRSQFSYSFHLTPAPISRRTRNITMDDNSIKNNRSDGMVLTPAAESSNEKEEHSRTMFNISKGQVDHIVAPTLRGEISPDSLRTFVNTAERWLHDEPKNRPKTLHIVTKIELALEQQEKAEPLPPKDRTSVEGVSSSAATSGTSQKKKMNFMAPDEKINVADDASPSSAGQMLPYPNSRVFSLAELKAATRNFKSDSVLGEGGFGKVYKGCLDERFSGKTTLIAVKKLNSESVQGFLEWQSEVNFLGRLSHPNLVKLLGYCWEEKELLLVYEFMPKGSLENHLFGRGSSVQPLPWDIRLKILNGAARGLAFLHATEVIYRDFKASNILLDGSYQAKLSDFGLAKLGPTADHSHVTTQVMGTYGYAAPEYVATGHLYVKSDVYGFGVVLVEMLTGLRALDINRPSGQNSIADWIKPHLSG